jgi:hypothetical protein
MMRLDYVLFRADGSLAALVEANAGQGTSPEWAAQFRRNIMEHGNLPPAEFFVFVTRESIYLWRNAGNAPVPVPPHAVIPTAPLLTPYFERFSTSVEEVDGLSLETIVGSWLSDLSGPWGRAGEFALEHGLAGTGFVEALRGGRIEYKDAA